MFKVTHATCVSCESSIASFNPCLHQVSKHCDSNVSLTIWSLDATFPTVHHFNIWIDFLRSGSMHCHGWPWTPDHSASTFHVLGLHACISILVLRRHFSRESCFCSPNSRHPTGRSEPYVTNLLKLYVRRPYSCHELFGFDIMLDENLKPWVLEVNISPR